MDLTYPPEAEEFRLVIRDWLTESLPEGWGQPDFIMKPDERAVTPGHDWDRGAVPG